MISELSSTNTYIKSNESASNILGKHNSELSSFNISISKLDLPTLYCIPKLHKSPYKFRFIANSSNCSTTILSRNLTSALTAIKEHITRYCETVLNRNDVNLFWSIKNSGDVIEKMKSGNFQANTISSYDFSNMYTTLPHDKINDRLSNLIKWCFDRERKTYICTSESKGFFSSTDYKSYKSWTCSDLCNALSFLLDNIYVRFGEDLYKQVVGIPMGTNCAPLVADLFLYTYEKEFIQNLQKQRKFDELKCFNNTSRYLDDILTIDNPAFELYKNEIYPQELTLNKANLSNTETPFLDLNIKIVNGKIHTSVYDKRDDFGFNIVNFPWLDGDVPRLPSYGIYISQLIRYARACTDILDFHSRNLQITKKLLGQGFRFHKLVKTFWKFYKNYSQLLLKFGSIHATEYITMGITQPVFYGDMINKIKRIKGRQHNHRKCVRIIKRLLYRGYDPNVTRRTLGLVLDQSTVLYKRILETCTLTDCDDGTP